MIKAYYETNRGKLYCGDCLDILPEISEVDLVVTDPPYNVGYKYDRYKDNLTNDEYVNLFFPYKEIKSVFIHYPEDMIEYVCFALGTPQKCVSWVYNSNIPRQHRMIAWFNCKPDFSKVKQPYKNLNDKRIIELIENGNEGTSIYDWWEYQQVKNVSEDKTEHPCQIPVKVFENIILTTSNENNIVLDPFMGGGSLAVACEKNNRNWIGCEISEKYCEIAAKRIEQFTSQGKLF
jgi:DNA modification methylase